MRFKFCLKRNSWTTLSYHAAHDMLHVISALCLARNFCTRLRPGHLSVRVRDNSRRSEETVNKPRTAPLNAIITIIIIGIAPFNAIITIIIIGIVPSNVIITIIIIMTRLRQAGIVCMLVGYLTSQQHAGVSQGRICSDNCTCCHTEIEVADQTFHLTQSQYTDTGPTSPIADPITPGGSLWSAKF